MCSSKFKVYNQPISRINGRPVLQPATSNQVPNFEKEKPKKLSQKSPSPLPLPLPLPLPTNTKPSTKPISSPPISPKLKSPRPPAVKRGKDQNELNLSGEKIIIITHNSKSSIGSLKKCKSFGGSSTSARVDTSSLQCGSTLPMLDAPGSIAAARREQVAVMQEQRKMRISHYGRTKSAKVVSTMDSSLVINSINKEEKRCTFITTNSDPTFVAYHDEEWGVAVHDDKLLFELLTLTSAQIGSDWTSVLKKRQLYREAFSGFDAEVVAKFNEKKITSISADYGFEISQVRAVVDNSNRILQIKKEMGSFEKYLWGFVNQKPIVSQYKTCQKIPVKTSKSESISKDMVKRGFRFVGPTVIYSFMQAVGLTNDHLTTCPRHIQCIYLANPNPPSPSKTLTL